MGGALATVVVPVFDGEEFLADALGSVLEQDHHPIEIVVVDDGSTDRSAEIPTSLPGVECLRQSNLGPSAARNTGVAAASGRFVTFLDADDIMLAGRIAAEIACLLDHPGMGCVVSRWEPFFEPGTEPPEWLTRAPQRPATGTIVTAPGDIVPILREGGMCATVRAEALDAIGPFDEDMRAAEDLDWLFRAHRAGEVIVLDEVLTRKRIHARNLTHDRVSTRSGWVRFIARQRDAPKGAR